MRERGEGGERENETIREGIPRNCQTNNLSSIVSAAVVLPPHDTRANCINGEKIKLEGGKSGGRGGEREGGGKVKIK